MGNVMMVLFLAVILWLFIPLPIIIASSYSKTRKDLEKKMDQIQETLRHLEEQNKELQMKINSENE